MEIILAGSLLGAGLLFNNKQETSREKVSPNIPNNKNIYETNFNKLEHNDKKLREVRFEKGLENKDGIIANNIYQNNANNCSQRAAPKKVCHSQKVHWFFCIVGHNINNLPSARQTFPSI